MSGHEKGVDGGPCLIIFQLHHRNLLLLIMLTSRLQTVSSSVTHTVSPNARLQQNERKKYKKDEVLSKLKSCGKRSIRNFQFSLAQVFASFDPLSSLVAFS